MKWESTIMLKEPELNALVRDYVIQNPEKFGFNPKTDSVKDVKVRVGSHLEGYGFGEHEVLSLENVTITLERDTEKGA